jgi:predicted amidophosphoribosyltransferase
VLDRALKKLRDGFVSIAYPASCHICSRPVESIEDGVVCSFCWNDETITKLLDRFAICVKCGAPLFPGTRSALNARNSDSGGGSNAQSDAERCCGKCTSAPFTLARSCGVYAGALEASILFLKTQPHICARLRSLVRQTALRHREELAADVVIPVPLHPLRERSRGFNQATIIAESIASSLRLPLDDRSLARVKDTQRHRAGLDVVDRLRSVARAFEVVRPRLIDGAAVLLVDDVYTTGSTVSSAAGVLAGAGAVRVGVLTVSRVLDGATRVSR